MKHIVLCISIFSLTFLELVGTTVLTIWARTGRTAMLIAGVYFFALLGLALGMSIRHIGHMNVVNALWQSLSIVSVTIVSTLYFKEDITQRQALGAVLAVCASLCFL